MKELIESHADRSRVSNLPEYRFVAISVLSIVTLLGCTGAGLPKIRSEADIMADRLSASVDIQTIESLAAFAAKDRICRASKPQSEIFLYKGAMVPMDAALGPGLYGACIYDNSSSVCDATVEDLGTLKTLMDRDPRLTAIANFRVVLRHINESCAATRRSLQDDSVSTWPERKLHRCKRDQPALINQAIAMRWPQFKSESDRRIEEWARPCADAAWTFLAFYHCPNVELRELALRRRKSESIPRVIQQGIEPYFCVAPRRIEFPST